VIVDRCELESQLDGLSELLQETAHVCLDGIEALDLLVVVHEHVRVHLVDEHFVADVRLNLGCVLYDLVELLACTLVVSIVSIYNIDEGTTVLYVLLRVAFEHEIAREIDDRKLDVVIVADLLGLNSSRWQQEESLVRRHLLENDFRYGSLARLGHPH